MFLYNGRNWWWFLMSVNVRRSAGACHFCQLSASFAIYTDVIIHILDTRKRNLSIRLHSQVLTSTKSIMPPRNILSGVYRLNLCYIKLSIGIKFVPLIEQFMFPTPTPSTYTKTVLSCTYLMLLCNKLVSVIVFVYMKLIYRVIR